MATPIERDPVPYATVEALAKSIRDLRELERSKSATQAELIRWCVRALKQTTGSAKKVREDRAKAILYLEWLATQLENQSVGSPDNI